MLRRALACLVMIAACGPAAPAPQAPALQPGDAEASQAARDASSAQPGGAPSAEVIRWIARLEKPHERERAVGRLHSLGDPDAIPALGEAWLREGHAPDIMRTIISLARPMPPEQAAAADLPAYAQTGRPARWDLALPFFTRALTAAKEANPRSFDSAEHVIDAIAEARLVACAPELIAFAQRPAVRAHIRVHMAAVRTLGKLDGDRDRVIAALTALVERDPPPPPRRARSDEDRRQRAERLDLALAVTGAAIDALAELRAESVTDTLVLALYRYPELIAQLRHALVASGPRAALELRKILRGQHAAVNQLFAAKQLDRECDAGGTSCRPVSARDYHAAIALGGFYDASAVPELLAALRRPAAPAFIDDAPGPSQHIAILDALRKIGAPAAAPAVRALWADREQDRGLRAAAIATYPFVAPPAPAGPRRDDAIVQELGKIAADNAAPDELRRAAATAYARLSRDPRGIATMQALAKRYLDASADKRRATERARPSVEVAELDVAHKERQVASARGNLKAMMDHLYPDDEIRAATDAVKHHQDELQKTWAKHGAEIEAFHERDRLATAYLELGRLFQLQIARLEVANRCKDDLACYAAGVRLTTGDAARNVAPYINDFASWTDGERGDLLDAVVDRAALEIGRRGAVAQELTTVLLDSLPGERSEVRLSVLSVLPRIARPPCPECLEQLQRAYDRSAHPSTHFDLGVETRVLHMYFAPRPR